MSGAAVVSWGACCLASGQFWYSKPAKPCAVAVAIPIIEDGHAAAVMPGVNVCPDSINVVLRALPVAGRTSSSRHRSGVVVSVDSGAELVKVVVILSSSWLHQRFRTRPYAQPCMLSG